MKKQFTRGNGLLEGFLAKKRAELANSKIDENLRGGRILDIGCGSYPFFLSSTDFKEKYGIDPVVNLTPIRGINLKRFDISKKKIPYEDNFFDVVTMLAVFEHVDGNKLEKVLSEVRRVLKKEGKFIITTPAPWADKMLHFMAKVDLISSEEIHEHKHNHSKKRIEIFLKESGFKREKIESGYFELGFNMWFAATK